MKSQKLFLTVLLLLVAAMCLPAGAYIIGPEPGQKWVFEGKILDENYGELKVVCFRPFDRIYVWGGPGSWQVIMPQAGNVYRIPLHVSHGRKGRFSIMIKFVTEDLRSDNNGWVDMEQVEVRGDLATDPSLDVGRGTCFIFAHGGKFKPPKG